MKKMYLGNGVYVEIDKFGRVVLTTSDGVKATNTIVMETEVLNNLQRWLESLNVRNH